MTTSVKFVPTFSQIVVDLLSKNRFDAEKNCKRLQLAKVERSLGGIWWKKLSSARISFYFKKKSTLKSLRNAWVLPKQAKN